MGGGEGDVRAGEGAMLGIVDDALKLREDGGAGPRCDGQEQGEQEGQVEKSEAAVQGKSSHSAPGSLSL
ncbi:MAG: hypothetical protein ABR910_03770 [Acidobacteriaceae bacterium]